VSVCALAARRKRYTLARDIVGFSERGVLTQIVSGSELEVVGRGFSRTSIKAQANGRTYFLFVKDLEEGVDFPVNLYE
jgi:hypothetical protein